MKRSFPFLMLFAALAIGYAPEWASFYVDVFSPSTHLKYLGQISDYRRDCRTSDIGSAECSDEYQIPPTILPSSDVLRPAIGVGTILSATEFLCTGSNLPFSTFDDPASPGRSFDVRNAYQIVPFDLQRCPDGITIRAWSLKGAVRRGYVGGAFVTGPYEAVERVKSIAEFASRDIRIVMALIVFFALIVNQILMRVTGTNRVSDEFERFHLAWFGYLAISSGLVQIAIPLTQPGLFGRLSGVFSLVAHLGPVVAAFARHGVGLEQKWAGEFEGRPKTALWGMFGLALVVCFSPWYLKIFAPLAIFGAVAIGFLGLKTRSARMICYGIALFINALKLLDIPHLPHAHLASLFASAILCESAIRRLSASGRYLRVLAWIRTVSKTFVVEEKLIALLKGIAESLDVGRVTLIELHGKGECEISFAEQRGGQLKNSGIFSRQRIPTVSAHVVTTKQPIWHVQQQSDLHRMLHRGSISPSTYQSSVFSVTPVLGESDVLGVLALTNYDKSFTYDSVRHDELVATIGLLEPYVAEIINKRKIARRLGLEELQVRMLERLQTLEALLDHGECSTIDDLSRKFLECFIPDYSSSGFVGHLDIDTRRVQVLATTGYRDGIDAALMQGTIVADPANQQGPLPLAVSRNEIIQVSDIANVEHVLNPKSFALLIKNDTKSMAAVPLHSQIDGADPIGNPVTERSTVWGVLWLEQRGDYSFGLKDQVILSRIQSSFIRLLAALAGRTRLARAETAITESMPARVAARLLAGEAIEEHEQGYLLMVDLKDSSRLASLTSSRTWEVFVKDQVVPAFDGIAKHYGLVLQQVIWDAFYFTYAAPNESAVDENSIGAAVAEIAEQSEVLYARNFKQIPRYEFPNVSKIRACLVHGDVSRGFSNGPSKVWTVTGTAMAVVSKLETACKPLKGSFFMIKPHPRSSGRTKETGVTLPLTGDEIFEVLSQPSRKTNADPAA